MKQKKEQFREKIQNEILLVRKKALDTPTKTNANKASLLESQLKALRLKEQPSILVELKNTQARDSLHKQLDSIKFSFRESSVNFPKTNQANDYEF